MRSRLVLGILAGLFLAGTAAAQAPGGAKGEAEWRTAFTLTPVERALVLTQMRDFLEGVQVMTEALARDDMKAFAAKSRALGSRMTNEVVGTLGNKLPEDFRRRARQMHEAFDELAAAVDKGADSRRALELFAGVQKKCVSCHGVFHIREQAAR